MPLRALLLKELETEAATTRKVLARLPGDKLAWKPHEKSMSLGELAIHVASNPGTIAKSSVPDSYPVENFQPTPAPQYLAEILAAHDTSVAEATSVLTRLSDDAAAAPWCMTAGGNPIVSMSRFEWIRTYVFNHWYHHRGQLAVYLRQLNVPVPAIYGPSADES